MKNLSSLNSCVCGQERSKIVTYQNKTTRGILKPQDYLQGIRTSFKNLFSQVHAIQIKHMAEAYKTSSNWVKRMEEFFTQSDLNKDGYLSIEDFEIWSDNLEREVKADPGILQKARKANLELWESTGLKPGVHLTKEQFIERMAEVAVVQRACFDEGKGSLFYNMIDSVFDAVDTNRDGYLQLCEYETMMKVSNFDADTAKILFNIIDTNHDGKLSRDELREYNIKFWFTPDDPLVAGLYGEKFETNIDD